MNVLWICTDQQRFDTLGCYGNPWVKTPNIDRLAQMGVKFDRAYAQCPVCGPSRASFLTGRYPRTCGVRQNGQDITVAWPENFIFPPVMILHVKSWNQESMTAMIFSDGHTIRRPFPERTGR